jgi:hypothetical protein
MTPWERQRQMLGVESVEARPVETSVPSPPEPIRETGVHPETGVPRTGRVKGKYAGQACLICGTVIPEPRPRWTIGSMLLRGQYCTQACWQVSQKALDDRKRP